MKSNIQNVDPNYILINEQTLVQFGMSNMYHMMCTLLKIAEDHTSFSSSFMRKKKAAFEGSSDLLNDFPLKNLLNHCRFIAFSMSINLCRICNFLFYFVSVAGLFLSLGSSLLNLLSLCVQVYLFLDDYYILMHY